MDGNWSEFSEWSECPELELSSSSYQVRTRECNNPTPQFGGADCVGDDYETRPCDKSKGKTNATVSIIVESVKIS